MEAGSVCAAREAGGGRREAGGLGAVLELVPMPECEELLILAGRLENSFDVRRSTGCLPWSARYMEWGWGEECEVPP